MVTNEKILLFLQKRRSATGQEIASYLGISRQALNKQLKRLIEKGTVVKVGRTKGSFYELHGESRRRRVFTRRYAIRPGLAEDEVFKETELHLSLRKTLRKNVYDIANYVFTEIFNNAIDHSRSHACMISVALSEYKYEFIIRDFGIGIFNSIFSKLKLANEYEAIGELIKGKTTTMREKHTGEGVFFSSKAGDYVAFRSHKTALIFNNAEQDVIVEEKKFIRGTEVQFVIGLNTSKNLEDIYKEYAPREYDYSFEKTRVLVKLFQEEYVSRSEAKRLLYGLDKFKEIVLDFKGVKSLGQGYADEIFRVFHNSHPDIIIKTVNLSPAIAVLIKSAVDNKK